MEHLLKPYKESNIRKMKLSSETKHMPAVKHLSELVFYYEDKKINEDCHQLVKKEVLKRKKPMLINAIEKGPNSPLLKDESLEEFPKKLTQVQGFTDGQPEKSEKNQKVGKLELVSIIYLILS